MVWVKHSAVIFLSPLPPYISNSLLVERDNCGKFTRAGTPPGMRENSPVYVALDTGKIFRIRISLCVNYINVL